MERDVTVQKSGSSPATFSLSKKPKRLENLFMNQWLYSSHFTLANLPAIADGVVCCITCQKYESAISALKESLDKVIDSHNGKARKTIAGKPKKRK